MFCISSCGFVWFFGVFSRGLLSFSISHKTDLVATDLPNICLSGEAFILPSFLRNSIGRYRILVWHLLFFRILNMSFSCLLASMVLDEKPAGHWIDVCLSMMSCFFLLFFPRFSLWFMLFTVWLQCVKVWIYLYLSHFGFFELSGYID